MSDVVDQAFYGGLGSPISTDQLPLLMASRGLKYGDEARLTEARSLVERGVAGGRLRHDRVEVQVPIGEHEVFVEYDKYARHDLNYTPHHLRKSGQSGEWRRQSSTAGAPPGSRPAFDKRTERRVSAEAVAAWLDGMGAVADEWRSTVINRWLETHGVGQRAEAPPVEQAAPELVKRATLVKSYDVMSGGQAIQWKTAFKLMGGTEGMKSRANLGRGLYDIDALATEAKGYGLTITKKGKAVRAGMGEGSWPGTSTVHKTK